MKFFNLQTKRFIHIINLSIKQEQKQKQNVFMKQKKSGNAEQITNRTVKDKI